MVKDFQTPVVKGFCTINAWRYSYYSVKGFHITKAWAGISMETGKGFHTINVWKGKR